jgi:hypothetical protein
MFLTLVGVVMAIESARNVAAGDSDPVTIMSIARVVFAGFAAMGIAGALGYGLLRFFRRSGAR